MRKSGNHSIGAEHNRFKHGMTATPTYRAWSGMKRRCYSEHSKDYKNYGARGIRVCARWRECFEIFLEDMGPAPIGKTLERLDVHGDYAPANCVWADRTAQSRNRRYVKLDVDRAETIRASRRSGMTLQEIATTHGISVSHAHRVCNREAWA